MGTSQSPYAGAVGGAVSQSGNWTAGLYAPASQVDTFTATGASSTIISPTYATKFFGIMVVPTGGVTSWTVVIEGGLDGVSFTTLVSHTNVTPGSAKLIWLSNASPVLKYRANCTALVLGGGTNVISTIISVQ